MSSTRATPRERLLTAAAELFYAEGITATGIDRILAHAGVSKPTLYAHFGSKDALISAVLQRRHEDRLSGWDDAAGTADRDPVARILAVFDWLAAFHDGPGRRGCAFLNAAAELTGESPAREVVRRQKTWMRDYLTGLAREAGAPDPQRLGEELTLLVDGANGRVLVDGPQRAARDARRVAVVLLRHELGRRIPEG